jgi:RNA-binding protein YhbY
VNRSYVDKAASAFLHGTPYRYPVQAIEAGAKTLDEWCSVLDEYRVEPTRPEPVIVAAKKSSQKLLRAILAALNERPLTKRQLDEAIPEYKSTSIAVGLCDLTGSGIVEWSGGKFDPRNPPVYRIARLEVAA